MPSRFLVILTLAWVLCCPALCTEVHPEECATAEAPHDPHEHEHACFCAGAALPTGLRATCGHFTDQLNVAIAAPVPGELPEVVQVIAWPAAGRATVLPILPGAQPLLN